MNHQSPITVKIALNENEKEALSSSPILLGTYLKKIEHPSLFKDFLMFLTSTDYFVQNMLDISKNIFRFLSSKTDFTKEEKNKDTPLVVSKLEYTNHFFDWLLLLSNQKEKRKDLEAILVENDYTLSSIVSNYSNRLELFVDNELMDKEQLKAFLISSDNYVSLLQDLISPYLKYSSDFLFHTLKIRIKQLNESDLLPSMVQYQKIPALSKLKKYELKSLFSKLTLYSYDDCLKLINYALKKYGFNFFKEECNRAIACKFLFFSQQKITDKEFDFSSSNLIKPNKHHAHFPYFPYKEQTEDAFKQALIQDIQKLCPTDFHAICLMCAIETHYNVEYPEHPLSLKNNALFGKYTKKIYEMEKELFSNVTFSFFELYNSSFMIEKQPELDAAYSSKILELEDSTTIKLSYAEFLLMRTTIAPKRFSNSIQSSFNLAPFLNDLKNSLSVIYAYHHFLMSLKEKNPSAYKEIIKKEAKNFTFSKHFFEKDASYFFLDFCLDIALFQAENNLLSPEEIIFLCKMENYKKSQAPSRMYMNSNIYNILRKDEYFQQVLVKNLSFDILIELEITQKEFLNLLSSSIFTPKKALQVVSNIYPQTLLDILSLFFDEDIEKDSLDNFLGELSEEKTLSIHNLINNI